jgi:curli biogenesis system outer membrane secretion channel CsgG
MKPVFYLALALCGLSACSSSSTEATGATATECAKPYEKASALVGGQMRRYILVPGFNAKSPACWQQLRSFATSDDAPMGMQSGVQHLFFIDAQDADTWQELPADIRKKVVAEQLINKPAGVDEFTPDAQGNGYQEAK